MASSRVRMIDQLPVHIRAGTLSSELASRQRPREAIITPYTTLDDPIIEVMWPTMAINTNYWRSFLLAKAYATFFPQEGESPNAMQLMGANASMLMNILPPRQVSRDGELRNAVERAGMRLRFENIDTIERVIEISHEPEVIAFLDRFEAESVPVYQDDRAQQILCVGIIILTIGKSVNPNNYDGWIKNRIRTFSGALGIPEGRCIWTEAQCPSQEISLAHKHRL